MIRQTVHTWYRLSCGHFGRYLRNARGNTTDCMACMWEGKWPRVFVLETVYVKPGDD